MKLAKIISQAILFFITVNSFAQEIAPERVFRPETKRSCIRPKSIFKINNTINEGSGLVALEWFTLDA
ncbi:hypothetical protein [Flavobacterium sp. 3HN19-14]|uniref:hypothetical protein n=1 Tax=Flavobacterium sp. 3HN19-14 TaxID=3448133 RepID=UPI003EE3EF5E